MKNMTIGYALRQIETLSYMMRTIGSTSWTPNPANDAQLADIQALAREALDLHRKNGMSVNLTAGLLGGASGALGSLLARLFVPHLFCG